MSSNTENIEAKLCAYVDGDLDEHGKLEIEKHLQSNPQHRLLLEELKQTKFMMQALPHEVAPPELSETIHGQLERSVLLDGVGTEDVAATMKINRWPQLMAVAAVLFLATGLGVLVYVVLPNPTDVAFDPAAVRTEAAADRRDEMKSKVSSTEIGPVGGKEDAGARFPEVAVLEGDKDTAGKASKGGFDGRGESLTLKSEKLDSPVVGKPGTAGEMTAASARRVLIVLKTDNVAETNGQVASYLETNKISWSAAEPADRDVYLTQRFRGTNVQLREGAVDTKVAGVVPSSPALNDASINNGTIGAGGNNTFNAGNTNNDVNFNAAGKVATKGNDDNYNRDNRDNYQMTQRGRAGNDFLQSQQQAMPTQQSQQALQTQEQASPAQPQPNDQIAGQQMAKPSVTLNKQAADVIAQGERRFNYDAVSNENVIVARNLSREQAVMVVDSLGKLYAGQTAVVLDRDVLDGVPTRQLPSAVAVVAGSATQPALGTTQPSVTPGDGQTEWSQSLATRAGAEGQSKLGEAAPTTLPTGAAPPAPDLASATTRPVDGDAMGGGVSLPVFSPQQVADIDLKQQAVTTQPAELPLEVVIVVQPAVAVPGAVQPNPPLTTEPAAAAVPAPAPTTQPGVAEPVPAEMNQQAK